MAARKTTARKRGEADDMLRQTFGEFPMYQRQIGNCLAPLLMGRIRDKLTEPPPLFIVENSQETPTTKVGCSLYVEQIAIILEDEGLPPIIHTPRPTAQFDRDLDRMLFDFPDNKVVVVDRPNKNHLRSLATAWRDPNFIHQPFWRNRREAISVTAATLNMHKRIVFATGAGLSKVAETQGVLHNCDVTEFYERRWVWRAGEWTRTGLTDAEVVSLQEQYNASFEERKAAATEIEGRLEQTQDRGERTKLQHEYYERTGRSWDGPKVFDHLKPKKVDRSLWYRRQRDRWMQEDDEIIDSKGEVIGRIEAPPYSMSRKQLLQWTRTNRDDILDATDVLIADGWLEKNGFEDYLS